MRSGINIDRLNGSCRGIVGSLRQRDLAAPLRQLEGAL